MRMHAKAAPSAYRGRPRRAGITELAVCAGVVTFGIGDFLIAVITFIIVALVIFLIVKIAKRYKID